MPYEKVIFSEAVLGLQEGESGEDIGDVVWVGCGAEVMGVRGGGVLRVGGMGTETVGD